LTNFCNLEIPGLGCWQFEIGKNGQDFGIFFVDVPDTKHLHFCNLNVNNNMLSSSLVTYFASICLYSGKFVAVILCLCYALISVGKNWLIFILRYCILVHRYIASYLYLGNMFLS